MKIASPFTRHRQECSRESGRATSRHPGFNARACDTYTFNLHTTESQLYMRCWINTPSLASYRKCTIHAHASAPTIHTTLPTCNADAPALGCCQPATSDASMNGTASSPSLSLFIIIIWNGVLNWYSSSGTTKRGRQPGRSPQRRVCAAVER